MPTWPFYDSRILMFSYMYYKIEHKYYSFNFGHFFGKKWRFWLTFSFLHVWCYRNLNVPRYFVGYFLDMSAKYFAQRTSYPLSLSRFLPKWSQKWIRLFSKSGLFLRLYLGLYSMVVEEAARAAAAVAAATPPWRGRADHRFNETRWNWFLVLKAVLFFVGLQVAGRRRYRHVNGGGGRIGWDDDPTATTVHTLEDGRRKTSG